MEIRSVAEIEIFETSIRTAADLAVQRLRELSMGSSNGLAVLRALKFESFGRHPLESRDLNLESLLESIRRIAVRPSSLAYSAI
jgi:hypothetical protein